MGAFLEVNTAQPAASEALHPKLMAEAWHCDPSSLLLCCPVRVQVRVTGYLNT
jgi:hypothetical protein